MPPCVHSLYFGVLVVGLTGSSPGKDGFVDSAVYQAINQTHVDQSLGVSGERRSINMQSKSFRVLAQMTGTESGKFVFSVVTLILLTYFRLGFLVVKDFKLCSH